MKKITKLMLTLALLLVGVTGVKAEIVVDAEVDFSQYEDGDASTIKFYGWGASDEAKARLSILNGCLHFESTEATTNSWDAQFHPIGGVEAVEGVTYTLHFKVKGSVAQNISAVGFGITPYGQFPITTEWVEGTFDYKAGANPSGDILFQCGNYVGEWDIAYLKITHVEPDVDRWLFCDGVPSVNNWDRQASYSFTTPLEQGVTYVVSADILSAEGGECSLWSLWDASPNTNQWGGTNDVQYLPSKTVNNTLTTYTWEFTANWDNDKISFVFGTIDGRIYFDNVSCKEKGTDTELIANGDFSKKNLDDWTNSGNTTFELEEVSTEPINPTVWTNIIFNSDMEGSDERCFYSQNAGGTRVQGVITDGIGNDGSRGIKVTSADRTNTGEKDQYGNDIWTGYDWDAQFFIRLPQMLPAGTRFRVSFDYKATVPGRADTQSHAEPGEYIWWDAIGSPEFTEEWQTYSKQGFITNEMSYKDGKYMHTISFNLSCNHTATEFFFDNVKFEIDENDVTLPDFNYYVSGSMNNWTPTEDYQLTVNPDNADEYMITMDLEEGDEFKIVKGANEVWYPGTEGNYVVNESGNYTIYFRPSGNGGNDWYYGVIYLARNYSATLTANTDWDEVYAYVWTGDGDAAVKPAGAWPGKKMELVNGVYTLSFNANNAPANIIFNNGKLPNEENAAQTKDLVFEDGKAYKAYTVKFINTSNWTNVFAYPYSNNEADDLGWSGRKMIKIGTDNLYSYTYVGAAAPQYIIFNNGYSGGSNQTDNFTYEDGATYVYDGISSVTKTISAAGYATYCSPYALDFSESGLTAYVANYDGSRVNFTEVTSVPAKTGVLLKGAAGEYTIKTTDGSVLNAIQNILIGVLEQTVVDHSGIYVLMNENGKVGFYQTTAPSFTVGANTAYIDAIPGNNARFISLDEETTSIDVRSKMEEARGDVYNLNGQRVAQPTKGLYIVNGKKVIVK